LDLNDFINLKKLDCPYNKLTSLDLRNLSKLESIECGNNLLTNLNNLPTNADKLTELFIGNDNFEEQDLSILSRFKNLRFL
jgi:hypothetical protein